MPTNEECNTHTVPELKDMCRDKGISGYSRLRKSELVDKCCISNEIMLSAPHDDYDNWEQYYYHEHGHAPPGGIPGPSDPRKKELSDGTVMVDGDPFIVYNDHMKIYASELFKEAEEKGYTSLEDKSRYLSGRLFEKSPYGLHEGSINKNAVDLFEGLVGDDVEEKYMICSNKTVLQRALLESQGIETRNHVFEIVPFSYPYKPRRSGTIVNMNDMTSWAIKPFVKTGMVPTFPHITADVKVCDDDLTRDNCKWVTMDASMDNTKRLLEIRPVPDKNYYMSEAFPKSITEWKDGYIETKPLIKTGLEMGDKPIMKDAVRVIFNTKWLRSPTRPKD